MAAIALKLRTGAKQMGRGGRNSKRSRRVSGRV